MIRSLVEKSTLLFITLFLAACAHNGSVTSEGVNDAPVSYGANRAEQLEADLSEMWQVERTAGEWYSSVGARGAARRVFEDMNSTFKGSSADVVTYLNHEPAQRTDEALVYRIEAPTYTDNYYVRLANGMFQNVDRVRSPRLKTSR